MSDNLDTVYDGPTAEIIRLRKINATLMDALQLFLKQWNACGPNSDFGHHFSNVRDAANTAIEKAGG